MARKAQANASAAIDGRECEVEVIQPNPVGRPRKFKSPQEMAERISEYFAECDSRDDPYTVLGLARYLGTFKNVILDYENHYGPEFATLVKEAKSRCEEDLVRRLATGKQNPVGCIFVLKNHYDYKDKTETEITNKDSGAVSPEELENKLAQLMAKYLPK